MPPEFKELESTLDRSAPAALSLHERERVWKGVEGRIAPRKHIPSPYFFSVIKIKHTSMITIAIALAVLLGASGTVAASDSARPGDLLFPVDRMAEEARIAFTTNADAKAELRARFAEERVEEFEEIVAEENARADADATISAQGEARVEHALSVLEGFLADADVRASSTAHARAVLEGLDARSDAVIRTLPKGLQLRLEGMFNTGTTSDEGSGHVDVDAEADILPTHTNVKVNVDGHPVNFTTSATTSADIVEEISEKLNIDASEIESVLRINASASNTDNASVETNVDVRGSLGL